MAELIDRAYVLWWIETYDQGWTQRQMHDWDRLWREIGRRRGHPRAPVNCACEVCFNP